MASLLCSGTVAYAQSGFPVYGNNSGCDVHFERSTAEATDMALLKEGRLLFYETACDVLVVGNQDGQISTLTAKCIGYEETYDFTWDFYSDGHEGFVLANPDQTYATVLSVCR